MRRVSGAIYLLVSLAVTFVVSFGPAAIVDPGPADFPFFVVLALHVVWGLALLPPAKGSRTTRRHFRRLLLVPDILASISLLFFLFTFIFALNANMDYVQRFMESGGNLRLALDTRTERALAWARVFPFVAVNLVVYALFRIKRPRLVRAIHDDPPRSSEAARPNTMLRTWAFLLTLLSAFLVAVAMPSFLSLDGFWILGWIAFVPLFLVLRSARFGHGVFYGTTFGVFTTLLSSYWLGTFNLVSLQITVLIFLIYYLVFTPVSLLLYRTARWARVLVFPLAFTLFEYLRSTGFLGYPWALAAHSQYQVLPLIQVTAVTGVWGLSFLVLLGNSAIAEYLGALIDRGTNRRGSCGEPAGDVVRRSARSLIAVYGAIGAVVVAGALALWTGDRPNGNPDPDARSVTIAQIQQNNDPRKTDYEQTFETLRTLTDAVMVAEPDLVVWSETAFVPNIRRWSEDTSSRRFHLLVREFLEYQRGLGTWLLTGNDDYEIIYGEDGREVRRDHFNAAVLFDDSGTRRETYHKIQLVPFTEHFPYRDQFPWVYELLLSFDVHFWAQGREHVVFEHPLVSFATPICYEDVFPNLVRTLVREGAEVIVNLSNDYWSLAEVQAKQHFVAGMFRAVENRRPVIRATASGLTGQVDPYGRVLQTAPYFQEAAMVSRVRITDQATTIYTRLGDYFPVVSGVALLMLPLVGLTVRRRVRRPEEARVFASQRVSPGAAVVE